MPPAVVPVEEDASASASAGSAAVDEKEARHSCHVAWLAWWANVRCLLATTILPCHASLVGLSAVAPVAVSSTVSGTLFLPSTGGDRRVRLFLQAYASEEHLVVLDLPAGLGGAEIAAAGRIVLEYQRQWAPPGTDAHLLDLPRWLVYCNGRRAGYAARRGMPSDAEGWVLEKLRAVTAGIGRLPGGGVEYLRGRFQRVVGSPDAESFHLVEPIGWPRVMNNGGAECGDGGLSIFFHRV